MNGRSVRDFFLMEKDKIIRTGSFWIGFVIYQMYIWIIFFALVVIVFLTAVIIILYL